MNDFDQTSLTLQDLADAKSQAENELRNMTMHETVELFSEMEDNGYCERNQARLFAAGYLAKKILRII